MITKFCACTLPYEECCGKYNKTTVKEMYPFPNYMENYNKSEHLQIMEKLNTLEEKLKKIEQKLKGK